MRDSNLKMSGEKCVKCVSCSGNLKIGLKCVQCKNHIHKYCESKSKKTFPNDNFVCKLCRAENVLSKATGDNNKEKLSTLQNEHGKTIQELQHLIRTATTQRAAIDLLVAELDDTIAEGGESSDDESQNNGLNHIIEETLALCTKWMKPPKKDLEISKRDVQTVITTNRFSILANMEEQENSEENVTNLEVNKKPKMSKRKTRRVLILSDSHGRGYSKELGSVLKENFEVTSIIKPNAKIKEVTSSVQELTKNFSEDDSIIILGGTNDISNSNKSEICSAIESVLPHSKRMKVVLSAIPTRYDKPNLNPEILITNNKILSVVNRHGDCNKKNIAINFCSERLERKHFTRHGLHMNAKGKSIMCKRYCELILQLHGLATPPKLNF